MMITNTTCILTHMQNVSQIVTSFLLNVLSLSPRTDAPLSRVKRSVGSPRIRFSTLTSLQALFQCLINICNSESYGRALAHSVSTCLDAGANIIPLHPIEVRQPGRRKDHLPNDMIEHNQMNTINEKNSHDFNLARRLSVALACNAGSDGLVTVSIAPVEPTASWLAVDDAGGIETMTHVAEFASKPLIIHLHLGESDMLTLSKLPCQNRAPCHPQMVLCAWIAIQVPMVNTQQTASLS